MKLASSMRLVTAAACALLAACSAADISEPALSPWPRGLQVWFSEPGISPSTGHDQQLPEKVGKLILSAKKSVDINIYELSVPAIYEALIEVHKKGIKLRMVGDIDNTFYEGYKALMAARVPMRLGNPEKIMHNKFVIVDDHIVTMGSMNYTGSGALLNNENVVFITSSNVAAYYKKEMDNMFVNGTFGLEKKPFDGFADNRFVVNPGQPDETKIEVYFTPYVGAFAPNYNANTRILEIISNARHTIHFAMFAFTSTEIANAIIWKATNQGVRVYGVFDKGWHESNEYSVHQRMMDAGLNIVMDGNENFDPHNPYHGSKVHDKIMVIDAGYDSALTLTGSFNFSPSAAVDGNDENCIIISNRSISLRYRDELVRLYTQGRHPSRSLGGDKAGWLDVIINEINWAGSQSDSGTKNYNDKFIELRNRTGRAINISGWQLWGTCSKSYRIYGHIFPANTVIAAGGYHVLGYSPYSSAFAWDNTWDDYLLLKDFHNASDQNYVMLTLKDAWQNHVDRAGHPSQVPYAGLQPSSGAFASMQRTALDGTNAASWATTTTAGAGVRTGWKTRTLATPGSD